MVMEKPIRLSLGSYEFDSRISRKIVDCRNKFKRYYQYCSIRITVSTSGFRPENKGSIPLWSTKIDFVAQLVSASVLYTEG